MRRSQALVLSSLVGMSLMTTGCVEMWGRAKFERDIEVVFLLPPGSGVSTTTKNGSITLADMPRDDVLVRAHVRATTQERADLVEIVGTADAGWLEIKAVWPEVRKGSEGVSFEIDAPGGRAVRADTGNGGVTITGFAGGADAETSNGKIHVEGHDGPISADTSNGAVTILGAIGVVDAETSNGTVRVELADDGTGPVRIGTSNGSVALVVGPGFVGQISADTSNGKIGVLDETAGGRASLIRDRKTSKLVQVGEGDAESRVDTSNGTVVVTVRD
jgi:hypothetical protein